MHDQIAEKTLGVNRRATVDLMRQISDSNSSPLTTQQILNLMVRSKLPFWIIRHFSTGQDFVVTGDGKTRQTAVILSQKMNVSEELFAQFVSEYAQHIGGGFFLVDGEIVEFDSRGLPIDISYEDDSVVPDVLQADLLTESENPSEG